LSSWVCPRPGGKQYIALAIGAGVETELIAFALP